MVIRAHEQGNWFIFFTDPRFLVLGDLEFGATLSQLWGHNRRISRVHAVADLQQVDR